MTRSVNPEMTQVINWPTWPQYDQAHEDAVLRVIRSNQLFAATEVAAFEQEFKEFVGASYAIGVGNATQGLQLVLAALGVGTGDEVIVTPYSWISSASCVLMQNAIPVFVDIEPETFGICPCRTISLQYAQESAKPTSFGKSESNLLSPTATLHHIFFLSRLLSINA